MVARSLAPFRHRGFRLVWAGALVSNIGTWMETTALAYYVADTSSASASGLVAAAGFLPTALLGPLGGAWADRFDRRRVVACANAVFALVAAGVALLVSSGHATAGNLALLAMLGGCASAISWPSFQAMLPDLVPPADLVGAIGLASTQWNLGRILGPTAAAIAISIGGVPAALWANVASFVGVIVAVLLAPVPRRPPVRRSIRVAVRDSLDFARSTPPVRAMLPLMALVVFFGSPFMGLTAQMATNVFGSDQDGTSLLVTAQGIGAVLAGASMGSLVARIGTRRALLWAAGAMVPVLIAYGVAPTLWSAAPLVLLAGAGYMVTLSTCTNITQRSASAEQRGRAMIVNNFLLGAAYPLGVYLQGELADRFSLRDVTVASGVGLGLSLLALRIARPGLTAPIDHLDAPAHTSETAHAH